MVQVPVINAWDDIDYQRDKSQTPADYIGKQLSFDGITVELDMSEVHYKELRDFLTPYLQAGKKLTDSTLTKRTRKGRGASQITPEMKERNKTVREWHRSQGKEFDGAIPGYAYALYDKAMAKGPKSE